MTPDTQLVIPSPIGTLVLRARNQRLIGIVILGGTAGNATVAALADESPVPVLRQARQELEEYFAGRRRSFTVPLDLTGLPPFTRKVLVILGRVPCGRTLTYGELAARAGAPRAARAIGRAMATNPLPIVIPCHRVLSAGGRPGGYSGGDGLPTKSWLLAHEAQMPVEE
jgi:methylated-DNA-[protein]-cysteine S-methyltransferase